MAKGKQTAKTSKSGTTRSRNNGNLIERGRRPTVSRPKPTGPVNIGKPIGKVVQGG